MQDAVELALQQHGIFQCTQQHSIKQYTILPAPILKLDVTEAMDAKLTDLARAAAAAPLLDRLPGRLRCL